jgi:hypothetical protein
MYLIASIGMSNEVCWQTNEDKKFCSNIKFVIVDIVLKVYPLGERESVYVFIIYIFA